MYSPAHRKGFRQQKSAVGVDTPARTRKLQHPRRRRTRGTAPTRAMLAARHLLRRVRCEARTRNPFITRRARGSDVARRGRFAGKKHHRHISVGSTRPPAAPQRTRRSSLRFSLQLNRSLRRYHRQLMHGIVPHNLSVPPHTLCRHRARRRHIFPAAYSTSAKVCSAPLPRSTPTLSLEKNVRTSPRLPRPATTHRYTSRHP